MAFPISCEPPPADFPNHLALGQPERLTLKPSPWLLVGLVLLCLAPRAWMARRIASICPDGVLYINAARALEAGNLHAAFQEMSLNVYPVILVLLHRLGMPWESAAVVWNVVISCLVVLPLYGWVRRQFDDRLAIIACLLYAVHPKFIEWSPEVMRDPTFWFLFILSIYWLWRAVTEARVRYFVTGGAAVTLAVLTRTEGWFLLIPFALWTFWRWLALGTARQRVLWGAALGLAVFPSLLLTVNLAWVHGRGGWAAPRLKPLERVEPWLQSLLTSDSATEEDASGLEAQRSLKRMVWVYFPTLTRGLSPIFALLMFGGMWGWRRVWARRDHQPPFYTALLILLGIWVQLWFDRDICPRYALPIVLMASPFAALGLLTLAARLLRIAAWFGVLRKTIPVQRTVLVTVLLGVAVAGIADAWHSNRRYSEARVMAGDLGRWVRRQFSAPPMLVGPVGLTPVANYYAFDGPCEAFRWETTPAAILAMVQQSKAEVVLLRSAKQLTPERCASLAERMQQLGFRAVDRADLPPTCDEVQVLLRDHRSARTAPGTVRR